MVKQIMKHAALVAAILNNVAITIHNQPFRKATLVAAIGTVLLAVAATVIVPSLAGAQERCSGNNWAGHGHNNNTNFWGTTNCVTKEIIDDADPVPRKRLWTKRVTEPHRHVGIDEENYQAPNGCTSQHVNKHSEDGHEVLSCSQGNQERPPTNVATATPRPTATSTPVPTATATPTPTAMPVPTATPTPTPTAKPTATSTPVPTATPTPTPTPKR